MAIHDKCQCDEDAEAPRPLLLHGRVFVARPHHIPPGLEHFDNSHPLNFEECEFDLPLCDTGCRSRRISLVGVLLHGIHGLVV